MSVRDIAAAGFVVYKIINPVCVGVLVPCFILIMLSLSLSLSISVYVYPLAYRGSHIIISPHGA